MHSVTPLMKPCKVILLEDIASLATSQKVIR